MNQISRARFSPDDAGEVARAEAGVEGADARAVLAERRRVRGDGEVGEDVQDVAAADGDAVDGSDDRLGDVADHPVQRLDLEQAADSRARSRRSPSRCFWSPPEQNAFSPAPVRQTTPTSSLAQACLNAEHELVDRLGTERVVALRPVDRDPVARPFSTS